MHKSLSKALRGHHRIGPQEREVDLSNVKIRAATPIDLERIMEIENKCFPGDLAYKKRQMRYLVLRSNGTVLVEESGGAIRGFVMVLYRAGSKVAGIETINVDPDYRGMGVGKRLLEAAEDDMRRRRREISRLEVGKNNNAAVKLYEKAGYRITEEMKNYYIYDHDGSRDALRMTKNLLA